MIQSYADYNVEIKNLEFKLKDGSVLPRTVIVSFLDERGKILESKEYGFVRTPDIYTKIEQGEAVSLDNCYIHNFSLTAYRRTRILTKNSIVHIRSFSAEETFFDSSYVSDFSYCNIEDGNVSFRNAHFANGDVSFNSLILGDGNKQFDYTVFREGDMDFSNVEFGHGNVSFKNALFGKGKIDFQYADFGYGDVSFVNTEFGDGDVSFINAHFKSGRTDFKIARFGCGKVDFHFAKWDKGDISFERVEFGHGAVDFRTVEFGTGRVNFNRSIFGDGTISFEASQSDVGKFSFKKACLGNGHVNFELLEFDNMDLDLTKTGLGNGTISFQKARLRNLSLRSCHLDHYVDLRVSRADHIDLSDTLARDIIDLKPYEFAIRIGCINFTGMRLLGRVYIDWESNKVESLIKSQECTSNWDKAEQFRTLKENFNVTGQYNDEDKAYVEFKRLEQKVDLAKAMSKGKLRAVWEYPWYAFKTLVFDKAGLYATDPLRVLFSMLVSYLFFSLLYALLLMNVQTDIVSSLGDPDKLSVLSRSFYHSAITFLTIGYGDYYPSGVVRWLSSLEGFIGLFLMSYFTVAFVRKILR